MLMVGVIDFVALLSVESVGVSVTDGDNETEIVVDALVVGVAVAVGVGSRVVVSVSVRDTVGVFDKNCVSVRVFSSDGVGETETVCE